MRCYNADSDLLAGCGGLCVVGLRVGGLCVGVWLFLGVCVFWSSWLVLFVVGLLLVVCLIVLVNNVAICGSFLVFGWFACYVGFCLLTCCLGCDALLAFGEFGCVDLFVCWWGLRVCVLRGDCFLVVIGYGFGSLVFASL